MVRSGVMLNTVCRIDSNNIHLATTGRATKYWSFPGILWLEYHLQNQLDQPQRLAGIVVQKAIVSDTMKATR